MTESGSRLHVTYLPDSALREAVSGGPGTHVNLSMNHAIVVVMAFEFDGSHDRIWLETDVNEILSQSLGKRFIQRNCVVVVAGGEQFIEAQREGRIASSFTDYCRKKETTKGNLRNVFHGAQERWLLFNATGSPDVLNRQREDLVDMIDSRVVAASSRKLLITMETRLAELEERVLTKTAAKIGDLRQVIDGMRQDTGTQLAELEERVLTMEDLKQVIEKMRKENLISQWDTIKSVALTVLLMVVLTRLFSVKRLVRRGM